MNKFYFGPMKNISFFCLLFCLTILGCDKEKSGTPKSGNDYYMFSITIDGVTHKVEGNYNSYFDYSATLGNGCYATVTSFGSSVVGSLADKGAASYISGDVFRFQLNFSNLSLGSNDVDCQQFVNSNLNWPESECNFTTPDPNTFQTSGTFLILNLDNVIITDLGTPGTYNPGNISNPYTFGDPIIGSFSGTVYGCSTSIPNNVFDIPVQLEIEFVAPRLYN